jgi:predicted NACHT family NTPase
MDSLPFNPNDIEALRRRIAELETSQHPTVGDSDSGIWAGQVARIGHEEEADYDRSGTVIGTQGGAFTQGSIEAGGHFIGRDFIQFTTQIIYDGEDPDTARSVIALYLYALVADLSGIKLGEVDIDVTHMQREPLQLADVYVPLNTQLCIPEGVQLVDWLSQRQNPAASGSAPQQNTRSVTALEALAAHRELTILGAPGSGKSTFGASVLLALAQLWQGRRDGLATLGDKWALDSPLPVRVVLRRFADQLPDGTELARAGDLWAFIGRDLEASGYGLSADTSKYVQRLARCHGALILFDGLDECGNAASQRRVLAAVQELMRSAGPKCRFLITARPYAWPGGSAPARGVYVLADLSDEQIERFIQSWYAALVRRAWLAPGDAERKSNDLLAATGRPDLTPLSRSPLLLTLMATMHANRGRLPDDRADLYDETVELLMLRWNRQIGADKALLDELSVPGLKLSDIRAVLEELAFGVHETTSEAADGFRTVETEITSKTEIGEDQLLRAFRPLLNNSWDKAALVVEYVEKRAGLLLSQGEKQGERQFAFPHRTIQEFLAARHLASRVDFPAQCLRLARDAPGACFVASRSLSPRRARSKCG